MITALDERTALFLIDLQNGIVDPLRNSSAPSVLENAAKLVAAFRKASLPIVIVHVDPSRGKMMQTRKDAKMQLPEITQEWLQIVPEIKTEPQDILILKNTWNAFYETEIDARLRENNITGIVLAGISTSIGVEGTARSAAERGYNITLAQDAMTDRVQEAHENSITYIFPRLGEVGITDEVIEKIRSSI